MQTDLRRHVGNQPLFSHPSRRPEDTAFMSRDHPLVRGAMDVYLGSQTGNAAFGVWTAPDKKENIFLEVHSVIECIAPAALHVDRFLPATPMRVLVDQEIRDRTGQVGMATKHLLQGDLMTLLKRKGVKRKLLPAMLEKAQEVSREQMKAIVAEAAAAMEAQVQDEIDRLEDLGRINDHVRPGEIAAAKQQKADLLAAITGARLRLDALRLIWRVP